MQQLQELKRMSQQLRKRKKWKTIVFLAKSKLNSIEVLISKALINSYLSDDEFVLINNVFKKYDIHEEIKKRLLHSIKVFNLFMKQFCLNVCKYRY